MKIIKYILLPIIAFLDYFNYCSHLETYRYCIDNYVPYKTPTWINNFYKSLKKGKNYDMYNRIH